jgi:hypothetical protein
MRGSGFIVATIVCLFSGMAFADQTPVDVASADGSSVTTGAASLPDASPSDKPVNLAAVAPERANAPETAFARDDAIAPRVGVRHRAVSRQRVKMSPVENRRASAYAPPPVRRQFAMSVPVTGFRLSSGHVFGLGF